MEHHRVKISGGTVEIAVNGVPGGACIDATKQVEEALGKVTQDTPTPEMFEHAQTNEATN